MSKKTSAAVTTVREDIYSKVTQKIIASLEQGVRPWMKPWMLMAARRCTGNRAGVYQ
jgi:antirestriction protein ArdC